MRIRRSMVESLPGDLVTYYLDSNRRKLTHIGIIVAKEGRLEVGEWHIQVMSQWGCDGEYLHEETAVPKEIFGTFRAYWSERKC